MVASRIPVYTCYLVVALWYLIRTVRDLGLICWKGMSTAVCIPECVRVYPCVYPNSENCHFDSHHASLTHAV